MNTPDPPRLDYAQRSPPRSTLRDVTGLTIKSVGLLMLLWGVWCVLVVALTVVGMGFDGAFGGRYTVFNHPRYDLTAAFPHVAEIALGMCLVLFGDRLAGVLMPR